MPPYRRRNSLASAAANDDRPPHPRNPAPGNPFPRPPPSGLIGPPPGNRHIPGATAVSTLSTFYPRTRLLTRPSRRPPASGRTRGAQPISLPAAIFRATSQAKCRKPPPTAVRNP